jgi:hypothetical protein
MKASTVALFAGAALALAPISPTHAADAPAAPAPRAAPTMPAPTVDAEAVQAMDKMSAFLRTLNAFELTTDTTIDLVTNSGQTVQIGGQGVYKVRRPDRFSIQVNSDRRNRSYIYDGKQFTMYAPGLDVYATRDAPATIRETLDLMWDKYRIPVPLEDLFRWGDPKESRKDKLQSGYRVGDATVNGVATDQYAFREGEIDWQVWIQKGAQPLPLKLVITDRTDPANPSYIARLSWRLNPTLSDTDFVFQPKKTDKPIRLTQFEQ